MHSNITSLLSGNIFPLPLAIMPQRSIWGYSAISITLLKYRKWRSILHPTENVSWDVWCPDPLGLLIIHLVRKNSPDSLILLSEYKAFLTNKQPSPPKNLNYIWGNINLAHNFSSLLNKVLFYDRLLCNILTYSEFFLHSYKRSKCSMLWNSEFCKNK